MAESYDELKQEHEKIKQEKDTDRKIIDALKDQINKLKLIIHAKGGETSEEVSDYKEIIEALKEENHKLRQLNHDRDSLEQEVQHQGEIINQLNDKLQKAKTELK